MKPTDLLREQPAPTGEGAEVWPLVIADVMAEAEHADLVESYSWVILAEDMRARDEQGREKYGTPLRAGNGRDALVDAYQEALDLCVYLKQAIREARPDAPGSSRMRLAYIDALGVARDLREAVAERAM